MRKDNRVSINLEVSNKRLVLSPQIFHDNLHILPGLEIMLRLFVLFILCVMLLAGCRYWVLYKFADQFCHYDDYVQLQFEAASPAPVLEIAFLEPVLDRHILLRYLNAAPFLSHYSDAPLISRDYFAIVPLAQADRKTLEPFEFSAGYHPLGAHVLLKDARLDTRLSSLFPPALVEPILRSICSDDYDLSREQLDMRFQLPSLDQSSLPSRQQIEAIMGQADKAKPGKADKAMLAYQFDFLLKDAQGQWQKQIKPILLEFSFDQVGQLKHIHIDYFKYRYWLDIESRSGRLLVIRN